MKTLRVGDMHVKVSNLKESEDLMQFILSEARRLKIDRLEFLGDLQDTHSLIRLEVVEFWDRWFRILAKELFETDAIVGNHDISGNYSSTYSSLHPFISLENAKLKIVHEPYVSGKYGYLPYIHSNEKFIEEANKLANQGATVLVSHPNFEGAFYDSGSPLTGGVNPDSLDSRFLHLIGGHIHTEIEYGRVWYTGNPRWMTKSCANKEKGIWLCEHSDTGRIEKKTFISTREVCTPIVSLVWKEGQDRPEIPANAKVDVELHGTSEWVTKQKLELKGAVTISSKLTDVRKSKERRSGRSLHEFLLNHYQAEPAKKAKLLKYMEGLSLVS